MISIIYSVDAFHVRALTSTNSCPHLAVPQYIRPEAPYEEINMSDELGRICAVCTACKTGFCEKMALYIIPSVGILEIRSSGLGYLENSA